MLCTGYIIISMAKNFWVQSTQQGGLYMKGFQRSFVSFCFLGKAFYWGHGKNEGEI